MKVRELMTPPISVSAQARVTEVAQAVLRNQAAGVAVLNDSGGLMGTVREKDLVAKHARFHLPRYLGFLGSLIPLDTRRSEEELRHVLAVTAEDLMSDEYYTASPDADIDDAASAMVDRDTDLLLVVEDSRLIGQITASDIIRLLVLEEAESDATDGG